MSTALSIALQHTASNDRAGILASLAFGAPRPGAMVHPGLQPLGADGVHESWHAPGPTTQARHGPFALSANADLLFGAASVPLMDDDQGKIAAITQDCYQHLFDCVHESGFQHLLRIWHFLPRINSGSGDRELYRRFCVGRAQAFDARAQPLAQLPAGTAIGARGASELLIYFIAARVPGAQIENPRQISAFAYPRRYGPRQPMFSRAVVWPHDAPTRLIVSGTASIAGHESRHAGDLYGQLRETWRNLECLRRRAGAGRALALRVYIRRRADYAAARAFVAARLQAGTAVVYLHAEICRAELLVEIEGIYAMPGAPG